MKKVGSKKKFKKNSDLTIPDFSNIDYELMLIDRHKKKPDDVKALQQSAYQQEEQDQSYIEQFFKEADANHNAILDFEEYKVFMRNV